MRYFRTYSRIILIAILFLVIFFSFTIFFRNSLPIIFVITATHSRYQQLAELHRLRNTFLHVKNLHWIVVEDSPEKTKIVKNFLQHSGLTYTHLIAETPEKWKIKPGEPFWSKPKGVNQRNEGLLWIRQNAYRYARDGVIYIADDDNSYSLELFEEMRYTKKVSTWPVGLAGELPWEGCVADGNGGVSRFWVAYKPERQFPIDMAAFAVNIDLVVRNPDALFTFDVPIGFQESIFLNKLNVKLSDLEAKADNCKKILVWHMRSMKPLMGQWNSLAVRNINPPMLDDEFYFES